MRVGLDVRYISHGLTGGIHTYVLHLAQALPLLGPAEEFVYYTDRKAPFELSSLPANVTVRWLPWSSPVTTVVNDRRIAAAAERDRLDVIHYPANYGVRGRRPMVVTLHDTLNLFPIREQLQGMARQPRRFATTLYGALATRHALKRADRLIADSDHARSDITGRTGFPADRIDVVPLAAGERFRRISDAGLVAAFRHRLDLPRHVIVADAIKNPEAIIRAHRALPAAWRDDTGVVFFSRERDPRTPVASHLGRDIRFIARPPTEDLVMLYNAADAFVFPSWYEGFGLPLVEAMQCGTPVIGAVRGSIPEVLGGAGLLFDIDDAAGLARQITAILESAALRDRLRQQSLARATAFSWERTARLTLEAYRRAIQPR